MSNPKKPILVCGITGNIGGELARLLVAAGRPVRGLTRNRSGASAALQEAVELVEGDFSRPQSLHHLFDGVEKAFFVAEGSNLAELGENFFNAARRAGVGHVVVVSSATTTIEPPTMVGRWHLALEEKAKQSGIDWTFLRPGYFASNALQWARMIRSKGAVFHPRGDARTAPIDPRDIAAVAFSALTTPSHESRVYTLTGSKVLTMRELVERIGQALEKPIRFVDVSETSARQAMLGSGMPEIWADAILELLRPRENENEDILETSRVKEVTGKEARSFDDWLKDNLAAFR